MGNAAKRKGSRNELKAIRILEKRGYYCCKAGGSLGIFDLIAIGPVDVRAVQVKTNRTAPPAERKAIADFICPAPVIKELWIFYDYKREPTIITL